MAHRLRARAMLIVAVTLGLCSAAICPIHGTAAASARVKHINVKYATTYDSIAGLLAATKVAVIATSRSVAPDRSSPRSLPVSLVTMDVREVLRGSPSHRIVVSEYGGQPGEMVSGQVPLKVGHTYMLLLGIDGKTGRYFVLNGVTGLFSYDSTTQSVTRLDPRATWIPPSFTLSLAEAQLRTPSPPTPTPKVVPPIAGACPPGCSLPSDYDAITVLASSANEVAIVTVEGGSTATPIADGRVVTEGVLQGNPHSLVYAPLNGDLAGVFGAVGQMTEGESYVVFTSFNRGGSCVSALFTYDPNTQVAAFVSSDDGFTPGEIMLPGRVLTIPRTITLNGIRERMYPTTGVVYPPDTSESLCPGP